MRIEFDSLNAWSADHALLEQKFEASLTRILGSSRELVQLQVTVVPPSPDSDPVYIVRLLAEEFDPETRLQLTEALAEGCARCLDFDLSLLIVFEDAPLEPCYSPPLREVRTTW